MTASQPIAKQILSISKKLTFGLLLLAVFAFATTLLIRTVFSEYRGSAAAIRTANTELVNLYDARLANFAYRLTTSDAAQANFQASLEKMKAASQDMHNFVDAGVVTKAQLDAFEEAVTAYHEHFNTMVEARAQYDELDSRLAETGLTARQTLSEIMAKSYEGGDPTAAFYAGRAQEALMLGRLYTERYRFSEAPEHLERGVAEIRRATQELRTLRSRLEDPETIALSDQTFAALMGYANRANALGDNVQSLIAARNGMDAQGPTIVNMIEGIVDQAAARQDVLGPRGMAISFWAVVAISVASIAIIGLGWMIAKRLSTRISNDVEEAVATMSDIAEGNLDAEVKNTEYENELGRMARALEVFKKNGKAAIAAAEREKEAEKERQAAEIEAQKAQQAKEEAARQEAEIARQQMIEGLSTSLGRVVSAASEGDFSKRVDANFDDEKLVALAEGVNSLVGTVEEGLTATGKVLSRVADGDLTETMQGDFKGAFKDLQNDTNAMIGALQTLVVEIMGSGENLASSSGELRDTSADLSRQAEQNAASLEETSAALEELTASIKQVSDNVSEANENAKSASATAESSSVVAAAAAGAMQSISEASSEITKVVSVINYIAFQINLLALNAGVEAARAGEAGRGFSVVASEVRQLAQRASEAAKEIDDVIVRSNNAVTEGVEKVTDAQSSLAKISDSVITVSKRIDEVSGAIAEQVNGVGEINHAVSQIDQNTQKQAASFEEVTAASGLLSNEAEALKRSTSRFKTGNEAAIVQSKPHPAPEPKVVEKRPASIGNLALDEDTTLDSGWSEF
jgi:methyl-accepting chemotaxis protein